VTYFIVSAQSNEYEEMVASAKGEAVSPDKLVKVAKDDHHLIAHLR
jgi:hypothetical protein